VKRQNNFKSRVNSFVFSLHRELLKTSHIGKKLLTAGRTNAHLNETYQDLGRYLEKKFSSGEIESNDPIIKNYLHTIAACKKDLREIEDQVNRIKFASGPEDISKLKKD
jgi:hypothetical protein